MSSTGVRTRAFLAIMQFVSQLSDNGLEHVRVFAVVVRAFDVVAVVVCDWVNAAMLAALALLVIKIRLSPLSSYSLLVSRMSRTRTMFGFLGATPAAVLQ